MFKIIQWLSVNLASVFAIIQAILKFIKEIATAIINLLSILIPTSKFIKIVEKVRTTVNNIDGWVEKCKAFFLKVIA